MGESIYPVQPRYWSFAGTDVHSAYHESHLTTRPIWQIPTIWMPNTLIHWHSCYALYPSSRMCLSPRCNHLDLCFEESLHSRGPWTFPVQVDPLHKVARCHEEACLDDAAVNTSLEILGLLAFNVDSRDGIESLIDLITVCYPNLVELTIPTWFEDSWKNFFDMHGVDPAFCVGVIQW